MRTALSTLAVVATAAAQSQGLVPANPGGALPAGYNVPNEASFYAGFGENPSVLPSRGGEALCVSGFVNVTASTPMNLKLNFSLPQNQSQVTEAFIEMTTSGSPFAKQIMGGMQTVNGTYTIGATLCVPGNNTKPAGVQLASHGIGFDRTYWDFAPGYSYADLAAVNGYATFFYDRLGVGLSSKPDALSVVQTPYEVAILHQLVQMLKAGKFSSNKFSKVVGVGHSFGSILSQAVTAQYPNDFAATVLTGFSVNSTGMPPFLQGLNLQIASQNQPYRFTGLSNGYLVSSSPIGVQQGFFRAPDFDPQVLSLADATKGTVTFGELFTISAVMAPAKNYTAPIAVVNGANDFPFCSGNCSYPTNLAQAVFPMLYPAVSPNNTFTYLAPVTGHGLNLHYTAVRAYTQIQNFLKTHV